MTRVSTAVVTGGAGFVGSHIVDLLLEREVETTVIDDLSTGSIRNLSQHEGDPLLHFVKGSASDVDRLIPTDQGVDVIFHEAALASVQKSISNPLVVHEANVDTSLHVMEFCLNRGVGRVVFASSAAVYGTVKGAEASESLLCYPSSPYGASKLAVEGYLSAFREAYGLETVALRYFNVYGPRQRMNEYSGVISVFADSLLRRKSPPIFGDGAQTRDFVHVKDVAAANLLAMDAESADGQVFNVASGSSTSVIGLFETLQRVTGATDVLPTFEPARRGDVKSGSASIVKIRELLGYAPSLTLEEGLSSLVRDRAAEMEATQVAPSV